MEILCKEDQPVYKAQEKGIRALSDSELLSILISGDGISTFESVKIARHILHGVSNNLIDLSKLSVNDLIKYDKIGSKKAMSIIAALELGKRKNASELKQNKHITKSQDAADLLYTTFQYNGIEESAVILLNRNNRILAIKTLSHGGVDFVTIDPRVVFKMALEYLSCAIILAHTHPSENMQPSESDIDLTRKMVQAGDLLKISVLDHLIIGTNRYYSFADNGRI